MLPSLECDDGTRLRVVYPGRPSSAAGPDFRDAVLVASTGETIRGDVEVHVRPGGWRAHGHGRDRRYNGVVLHVVLWPARGGNGGPAPAVLSSGARVPTTALFPSLGKTVAGRRAAPSSRRPPRPPPGPSIGERLDRAGDARFLLRASGFRRRLGEEAGAEVLYQGLMEALGYSQNREPFLRLAKGLPLSVLEGSAKRVGQADRLPTLQALLLGSAGLLCDGRQGRRAQEEDPTLPGRWRLAGLSPALEPGEWHLFRIRPENHPRRRLMGAAEILERTAGSGLLADLEGRVLGGSVAGVRSGLSAGGGADATALIGAGRAGDIAVNVVLPFLHAWGGNRRRPGLRQAALDLYRAWPALQENEVTREMAARLLPPDSPSPGAPPRRQAPGGGAPRRAAETGGTAPFRRTARRQQGLIHMYREMTAAA